MKRLNVILVRYLFIFLLFAGLILIFFVPVYKFVTDFTLDNELSHISGRMEQGIASLNSVFGSINLILLTAREDDRFTVMKTWFLEPPDRQALDFNLPALQALRDSINLALLPYSIDIDAGLLFPDGTAVTRMGIYYSPDYFCYYGYVLQCGDLTFEEWRGLLGSAHSIIPAMPYTSVRYRAREAITFSTLWAYIGYPEYISFFAALPVDGIISLLLDDDVAASAYVRMYNAQGELLFSRGSIPDGKFHVISRYSQANSVQYEVGVPDSFIAAKLRPMRNLILLFACIIGAFIIVISFLFAWRSSLPERNFLERVRQASIDSEGFNVFTGLKQIYHNLADSITSRLDTAMRTIETQTALIRTQAIDRIRGALVSGDEAGAKTILRECYAALPQPEDSFIAGLLAGMLYAMLRDLREELADILSNGIVPPFVPPEYVPGSQEELFRKKYPDCFALICENIRVYREKSMPSHGHAVLTFINDHLYDPGLYIAMIASHFNITAPTLQKLVKQCTGQTFQNYVEKRRLDKACELLSKNAANLTEIAHACGFSSVITFSRSFKRIYGYPPSRAQR